MYGKYQRFKMVLQGKWISFVVYYRLLGRFTCEAVSIYGTQSLFATRQVKCAFDLTTWYCNGFMSLNQ